MQSLDDTSSSDPDFGSCSGFFTKVETKEQETSSGSNSVKICCDSSNGISWTGEDTSKGWEPDEEESAGEASVS